MKRPLPILLFVLALFGPGCRLQTEQAAGAPSRAAAAAPMAPAAKAERVAFFCRGLDDADLVALTANVAACNPRAVVLLDNPDSRVYLDAFLRAYQPGRLVPVGSFN